MKRYLFLIFFHMSYVLTHDHFVVLQTVPHDVQWHFWFKPFFDSSSFSWRQAGIQVPAQNHIHLNRFLKNFLWLKLMINETLSICQRKFRSTVVQAWKNMVCCSSFSICLMYPLISILEYLWVKHRKEPPDLWVDVLRVSRWRSRQVVHDADVK